MTDTLDMTQIATVLSQLIQNYNELAQNWFNIFYNPNPADITLKFFDTEGNLQTYTLPNRAKDLKYVLNGLGEPEGKVSAGTGALYQDLVNGNIYLKKVTSGTAGVSPSGWQLLVSLSELWHSGEGEPDDENDIAPIGSLYTDLITGFLWTMTSEGWKQTGASGFAEIAWCEAEFEKLRKEIEGGVVHFQYDETIVGNKTFNGTTNLNGSVNIGGEIVAENTALFKNNATFEKVIMGTAYRALSADIAEYYEADEDLKPGTLIQFGGNKEITKAKTEVNGIVSTSPAYILNNNEKMEHPTLLTLSGRIPVCVVGPVHKFDKICLGENGLAKVDNLCYNAIGRALEENLDEGEKLVECVVQLQI